MEPQPSKHANSPVNTQTRKTRVPSNCVYHLTLSAFTAYIPMFIYTVQRIYHAAKIMFLRGAANCGQKLK